MSKSKSKNPGIDLPELLTRLQTLNVKLQVFEKDLKNQIDAVQKLFSLDASDYATQINTVLTNLEYFVNVTLSGKVDYFKLAAKQVKKIGRLN